jgi:NADP-reducing hydrogenase subunit HndA
MEITGIGAGDISPDGRFSYDATRCIGACGLAPVMTVNGDVYGRITPADVSGIIAKYL